MIVFLILFPLPDVIVRTTPGDLGPLIAFVQLTGQSSDAAIVITVALIATLFTPVRNALQRLVDTRFKDAKDLERLMESLETEVGSVMDVIVHERLAERLVRTAREGADAIGAALFLNGASDICGRPSRPGIGQAKLSS